MCQHMDILVRLLRKTLKVCYDYVVWKFWVFVNFYKYSCSFTFVNLKDTLDLV